MAGDHGKRPAESQAPSSRRPFPCDECSKTFTRNVSHHRALGHDFECDGCHAALLEAPSDVLRRHRGRCQAEASTHHVSPPQTSLQQRCQPVVDTPPHVAATDILTPTEALTANAIPHDDFWEQHSSFGTSLPREYLMPSSMGNYDVEVNVKNYFEHFNPSLPLLHRPTFTVSSAPKLLLKAVTVIGSLCSTVVYNDEEAQARVHWRRDTWQSGQQELRNMISNECGNIRKPWVVQGWILHMIYGAVREVGLSHQEIVMPESRSWLYDIDYPRTEQPQTVYTRWTSYITAESTRIALYTLLFLDSHIFVPCNSRPLMSSMELRWELPFPAKLWEAKDPEIWIRRFSGYFGVSALTFTNDLLHQPRGLAAASLTMATQQLMTEAPGTELTSVLEASPIAAFYVLANLDTLVRDFTRCYYQMPPSYSDPNPFHILTQSQTESVHMAIRNIGKIVKDAASTSDSPQFLQWRTNELFIVSLQVNLCRPDQLLIGGIVDNSLIAGLAASTHLMRGNFVAVRRSAPWVAPRLGGNEGVLSLLSELSAALASIYGDDPQRVSYEAPWVTVTSYGILLCIWGALRRATTEIRDHLNTFNELPRTSEPCMLIFNALMEAALRYSPATRQDRRVRDPRLWSMDRDTVSTLLEEGQVLFADMVKSFCQQRLVWSIGPSMLAVLRELPDDATS
ncbi:uncharacterized protein BO95DRAFT_502316 [Aspergillus brunneoviolaceus CBS 621.78]|uniref:Uncharacterized protein n=1 Tax=Aspergillus brunneoviolaceus CBS 621.78 TaxID=1450534 RepID=A0ACD1G1Q7_9EURO|nr:hypothetical protein BO95DRAFT_502316 [Aspergillus brunneoviolaceus CBS 621.78]RAH43161.1 hypothetical protein BO95DRAFT_502316 [Aspergillus brunneoviolaceus CBS 621.78]